MDTTPLHPSLRVSSVAPSLIRALHDARRPTSLNLGLGQPSLEVDSCIREEGIRLMAAGSMGYTANAGLPELREAIASHHALPSCTSGDNVVVTCGSQEAIVAALAACTNPGDDVVISDPAFPGYRMAATFLGLNCIVVPRLAHEQFRLRASDIAAALTERTKVVIVNSPGNPTGTFDHAQEQRSLAALAESRNFAIISDEIYADLNYTDTQPTSPAQFGSRTIVVSGLSKNCAMTGFRLGYTIAGKEISAGILRAHSILTTCAPALAQYMALFVFRNPVWMKQHLPIYRERRQRALDALKALPESVSRLESEGAFYLMLNLEAFVQDSLAFSKQFLQEADVIVTPGLAFGQTTHSWIRLSYADDPDIFAEGVRRLNLFLQSRSLSQD